MKAITLGFCFLLAACTGQVTSQLSLTPEDLVAYTTRTPSFTPEQPEGLLASIETSLPSPTPFVYEVQAGDTMGGLALKFGVSLDELLAANPAVSPSSMSIGTELKIPSNPANPSGASTPTPVSVSVSQVECYPTADRGMWCFILVSNDSADFLENLSAQATLVDSQGQSFASAVAISPLNILPPDAALPLTVYFLPVVPSDARPQVQVLTGIRLMPEDERYLLASLNNILVEITGSGRTAQASGQVRLVESTSAAAQTWIAGVAYDRAGRVVGINRWESTTELAPGKNLPFSFTISSLAGQIERVEFVVEARP